MTQQSAATKSRSFRSFLLMAQFEAKSIGKRIQQARKEAGLTQDQLADLVDVSKRSIQDYESGVTIPYKHLHAIGLVVKRPTDWFLHGEPEAQAAASPEELARIDARLETLEADLREMREEQSANRSLLEELARRLRPPGAESRSVERPDG